jgi:hypothetical protein
MMVFIALRTTIHVWPHDESQGLSDNAKTLGEVSDPNYLTPILPSHVTSRRNYTQ